MNKLIDKLFNRETVSYLIFGILTTVVDFLVYALFCKILGVNYLLSNIISWAAAVLFAYVTNKIFVFKSKDRSFKTLLNEISAFISARLFSLVFSLVFIYLCVILLGMNDLVAKIISCVFVVIINYVLSKFVIFKH